MAYRDELTTLRARVARLEGELDEANERIGRLTGEDLPTTKADRHSRFLGAPTALVRQHALDFEIGEDVFEDLASLWRARLGPSATVSQVGRTLTLKAGPGQGSDATAEVVVKEGRTTLKLSGDLRGSSVMLGMTTPGLAVILVGVMVAVAQRLAMTGIHALWILPLGVLSAYLVLRRLLGGQASKRRQLLGGTFAAMVERATAAGAAAQRGARIAEAPAAADEDEQALAEQEAIAGEEAAADRARPG